MMAMNHLDHGLVFQQWVNDINQQDLRHVPKLIVNLLMTVGGWEELDNFIYENGNDPTLGDRYVPKVTRLLGQGDNMNASLQWFMKECSVAAGFTNVGNGYQNVHQYEQRQPLSTVTRSQKYGFGAQKGNAQWHAKLGKAFHSLKTKAEEEAAATGKRMWTF
jgi:hypothetical protein